MAGLSLALAIGIYFLIPSQVSHEAIPGTGDYVKITPALLPLICVTAFGILSLVFLVESVLKPRGISTDGSIGRSGLINVLITGCIFVFCVLVLEHFGYLLTVTLTLLFFHIYFGHRSLGGLILGALVVPVILYLFFNYVMLVPLPIGSLFE